MNIVRQEKEKSQDFVKSVGPLRIVTVMLVSNSCLSSKAYTSKFNRLKSVLWFQVLKDASKKAGENVDRLKHESTRLEGHLQKGTNWWLWIAIAVVCATFMFMIFFIRFFPKPR